MQADNEAVGEATVPAPGEGKRGEAGYLAYLLRQAAAAVRRRLERGLESEGVTTAQFGVLTMLNAYPGASGADVARLVMLTPQTVHGITVNLERAGLVDRAPPPAHGRLRPIRLTKHGATLLARCRDIARTLDAGIAALLQPEEERAVRSWLVALAVEAETPTGSPR